MLEVILIVLIFLAGMAAGIILRRLTPEELKAGRKWFLAIIVVSLVLVGIFLVFYRNWAIILTLVLIAIISYISWRE